RTQKAKTYQFRQWKTLNLTDARASIEDSELSWCENALPIGNGAIQILNGPGASIATIAQGIASLWGVPFSSGGVFVSINSEDRKSTRLNSSHVSISYAVFCLN